ncbi:uncharacterized protein [Triticum aestivum]|uniref:uncharacterized protein isoform X5 n=1 Tax=Triticum aestivum TaxID=4565 RepID=UPI001D02CBB0|nr:uncharacterized protein LOC123132850 isoform X5 [Triticum aestivum]
MTRSSSSSTSSKPRALETAVDDPLLVLVLLILEHLLQTSSSGGGGVGKTTRAWGRRRLAPAARLAPRAGGLMMEDLHSWLHQRRRCRFCFCSPLAYSAAIGLCSDWRRNGVLQRNGCCFFWCSELHIPKEGQKSSLPDNYTCSFPRTGAAAAQGATPYSTVLEYTWCKSTSLIFRKSTCSQQQQQRQSPTAATDAVANSSSRSARSRSGGLQRWQ